MHRRTKSTHIADYSLLCPLVLGSVVEHISGLWGDDLIMLQLAISRRYELTGLPAWLWW